MRQELLVDWADTAKSAENSLSKAHVLCRELCEHYFQYAGTPDGQTTATDAAQQSFIVWEYGRYALYAHIIQDYLLQAEAGIASLSLQLGDHLKHSREAVIVRQEYPHLEKKRA